MKQFKLFVTTWNTMLTRCARGVVAMLAFLAIGSASASPITAEQAQKGMRKWVKSKPAAHMNARLNSVQSVKTVTDVGGTNLFHVVSLENGGFIVTPTDDRIQPVIAFSDSGTVVEDARNPLWVMLNLDLPRRMASFASAQSTTNASSRANGLLKASSSLDNDVTHAQAEWADLLADETSSSSPILLKGVASVSDVRVPILLSTKWGQSTDSAGNMCYNLYTPNHYVCGCVATAASQLMRKHCHPSISVVAKTFNCWVVAGSVTNAVAKTMMGGVYDWDNMPDAPGSGTEETQRQEIGKLCYDIGVASRMTWKSTGSGACLLQTAISFTNVLGYANACSLQTATADVATRQRAILANLDGGYPVLLGIRDSAGRYGHAIVADGYGFYTNTVYTHLNFGWEGSSDAWYALPDMGTRYSIVNTVVYNVFPDQTGELLTGRVVNSSGNPIAGVTVTVSNAGQTDVRRVTTNERGIYAAHVPSGTWLVSASADGYNTAAQITVTVSKSKSSTLTAVYCGRYSFRYDGTVGNSWGNDFTLTKGSSSYTITYKPGANGSGSAQTATKTHNVALTLKGAIFTRTGYTQTGWATSDGGTQAYALGASYTANAAITLYPVWTAVISAQTALDNSSLTFTTGGSTNWYGQTVTTHDGVDAMRSGLITHSQNTWLQTSVTGPGTISFWWAVSSESVSYDYLFFSIDGTQTNRIGGTNFIWTQCSYHLPSGTHTLKWTYRKDGSVTKGDDAGFLDQVVWTDDPSAPTISSVSTSYTSYAKVTWGAVSGATSYNVYRSTSTTRPSSAYVSGITASYYYDYGATPGVTYYYWVEAVNSSGSAVSAYKSGYRAVLLTIGSTSQNFVAAGGSTNVTVSANTSWAASADVSWITFTTSSGSSSGTLSYKVAANTATSSRSGTITVTAGGSTAHPKTVTISVTQAQAVAQTYAVTYSPGSYGTGSQQTATKTQDVALTLKGALFTRSGYVQTGWATSDGGTQAYKFYGSYTANAAITLYPVWTVNIAATTALDNSSLTFTTGGSANWYGQTSITHDGVDAMRSGPITHSQTTWMQTTVTGPGTVSFWWYASSERSCDYLFFSIDGVQTNTIGGTSCSWTQCSYHLLEGSHTLKWTYRKDGSVNSGEDAGFIDQVVWTNDPVAPTISSVSTDNTSCAKVTWGAVAYATSYSVYRSTSATQPTSALASGLTSTSYSDTGATPGVTYYYWVEAVNSSGSAVSAYKSGYRVVSLTLGSTAQSFIAAGGSTNVSVSANTSWTASASDSWITLTTSSGSSSGTLSYKVAANTVTSSRSGTITVVAGGTTDHPKMVTITVTQAAYVIPAPSAPTISSVSTDNTSYAKVTWGAVSHATSYSVYRSTTTTKPTSAYASDLTSTSYSDTGATPGVTYYYWVEAANSAGSAVSTYKSGHRAVSLSLGSTAQSFIAAGGSTNVTVSANTSWTASASDSWITLTISSGSSIGTLSYTVAANTVTSSRSGTITVTAGGSTDHPKTVTLTVTQAAYVVPAPSAPTISSVTTDNTSCAQVTWGAVAYATSYCVYRSTSATQPTSALASGLTSTSYSDTGATPGVTYYYWIEAVNSSGSAASAYKSGHRAVSLSLGSTAQGFIAAGGSTNVSVSANTSWTASASDSWITLTASSGSSSGTLSYKVAANTVTSSRSGTITVVAGGSTAHPKTVTITVTQAAYVIPAPSAPTISSVTTDNTSYALVSWGAVSHATSYSVYRSTSATKPTSAYATGITAAYYYDYNATPGVTYYYWVEAVNSSDSAASAYKSGHRAVSLSLGSTAQSFIAAGGSTNVSVTANTSWTASASDSWITLTTSSGSSSGTLSYKVAANTVTSSRSGTITVVAGGSTDHPRTVTISVTQAAYAGGQLPDGGPYTNVVDGVAWTFTVIGGKATLGMGSSSGRAIATSTSGPLTIPSSLGGCPVTSIGSYAFYGCSGLTSVTIPSSVTSIDSYAFLNCIGLTSVTIPSSVTSIGWYAFRNCIGLTSVTIPSSVTSIGGGAFSGCSGLTSVTIPSSVTSIGSCAFSHCSGLTSVTIPSSVTNIGESVFACCSGLTSVEIPSSVTSIGYDAFFLCTGLTSMTIHEGVTSIGSSAFSHCSGLTSVTIPSSVTNIGSCAFQGCSGLTSVTIPSSVTSIGSSAFSGCSGLTTISVNKANPYYASVDGALYDKAITTLVAWPYGKTAVTIPSSVTKIGSSAFYACSGLMCVTIPSSVTNIGNQAFQGCSGLTSVTIPSSVTSIGYDAFYGCSGLTSVTIPSSVTSIGYSAFSCCSGLMGVTISEGVTCIGGEAFEYCRKLTSVTIPSSVTNIGRYAFANCSGLTRVTISEGATSIDSYAFSGCSGLTSVTIPSSVTSICYGAFSGCSGLTTVYVDAGDAMRIQTLLSRSGFTTSGLTFVETYPVTYDPGSDGTGTLQTVVKTNGVDLVLAGSIFARAGYAQTGWATSDGGEQVYALGATYSDDAAITLYPVWTADVLPDGGPYTNVVDGIAWTFTISDGRTILGTGSYSNPAIANSTSGAIAIPSMLGGCPVTIIGSYAFYGCSGLTSVTIPSGVTSIGSDAFMGCSGLMSVTISEGVTSIGSYAFSDCSGLTSVVIPEGVMSIGSYAFSYCSGLTSVTIPSSVTSIGSWAFYYCNSIKCVTIPACVTRLEGTFQHGYSSITNVVINEGVTNIGSSAFQYCRGLTSVTIPSSVTSIGSYAFYGCSGLTSVTIPSSVTSIGEYAFSRCSGLTSVTIPSSVTSIGSLAFYSCGNLKSFSVDDDNPSYKDVNNLLLTKDGKTVVIGVNGDIEIPSSVTSIGSSAFYGCSGLTSVAIPSSVTSIGSSAFMGCSGLRSTMISEGVTSIGDRAFYDCDGLTSVTIPSSVTRIGVEVFYSCGGLRSVTLVEGVVRVVSIDRWAFSGCTNLTSVMMPTSVKSIGYGVFAGCSGLTNLTIPSGVSSIDCCAFENCSGLTSVTIPSSVISIGEGAFQGCIGLTEIAVDAMNRYYASVDGVLYDKAVTKLVSWPGGKTSVTISSGVTRIGTKAFFGCSSLTSVTIPSSVINIDSYAFYGCSSLTSVTIPSSVININGYAFYGCSKLTSVTILSSVTSIGNSAFMGCSGLTSVTIPSSVTSIGSNAFRDCSGLTTVYVDAGDAARIQTLLSNSGFSKSGLTFVETYRVTYAPGSDGMGAQQTVVKTNGVDLVLAGAIFTRSGYTQTGWSTSDGGELVYALGATYSDDAAITLYPVWKADALPDGGPYMETVNGIDWNFSVSNGVAIVGNQFYALGDFTGELIVPSVLGGRSVTCIDSHAFARCQGLTDITVPSCVTNIGNMAFFNCTNLVNVTMPYGVVSIGEYAFEYCRGLTSMTIPQSVTHIGRGAFFYCEGLTDIAIPSSVMNIDHVAFAFCTGLSRVTIPSSVTRLGRAVFQGCSGITEFVVEDDNPNYQSTGGMLLSKDGKNLLAGINGDVTIPAGVTNIEIRAFLSYSALTSVTIPSSVTSIGEWAFYRCDALATVYIDEGDSTRIMNLMTTSGFDCANVEFVELSHTVSYAPGTSGNGAVQSAIKTNGVDLVLAGALFTRAGYAQTGWATSDGGEQAYALGETYTEDAAITLYPVWTPVVTKVADPVITAAGGTTFETETCSVSITCATPGASIYYRTDGGTPRTTSKYLYTGAFTISETSEIVAFAVKDGLEDSEYVTLTVTKVIREPLTLAKALEIPSRTVTTGGDADWQPVESVAEATNENAAKSGTITHEQSTWMRLSVSGKGTISFRWRGDCEADPRGRYTYDCGAFDIGGEVKSRIDGSTEWRTVSATVDTVGEHVFTWTYTKDDVDEDDYEGGDCIWVDNVVWTPVGGEPIPALPDNPTAADVAEALAGAADSGLGKNITTPEKYNAFRDWAGKVKATGSVAAAGLQAVQNAPHAWLSYALDSATLIEKAPTADDIKVKAFAPATVSGKFDFTVSVDGVTVGSDALKENLKQVFGLEGSTSLNANSFSASNVDLTFGTPEDGKVKFTAGPNAANATSGMFFMKVKMTP